MYYIQYNIQWQYNEFNIMGDKYKKNEETKLNFINIKKRTISILSKQIIYISYLYIIYICIMHIA